MASKVHFIDLRETSAILTQAYVTDCYLYIHKDTCTCTMYLGEQCITCSVSPRKLV